MVAIRECQPEDMPQVEECFVELQDFLHQLEPNVLEGKAAKKYFEFMLARCTATAGKVFVVEADHRVVGFVCVWAKVPSEELDEEPGEYAFISDLVVLPAFRRQRLGQMLLERAESYARSLGVKKIQLEVLPNNTGALTLYSNHGFRTYELLLSKDL
ncbi:MAG: GNAT family N-acetyltransferase [Deltaproteobacteria bacterium]|nr:GNAT family N-acetyltransferase [Deltaproteobacteria bacterium]